MLGLRRNPAELANVRGDGFLQNAKPGRRAVINLLPKDAECFSRAAHPSCVRKSGKIGDAGAQRPRTSGDAEVRTQRSGSTSASRLRPRLAGSSRALLEADRGNERTRAGARFQVALRRQLFKGKRDRVAA